MDFVGYGTAETREGPTAASAPSNNGSSIQRASDGTDTNSNSADFSNVTPPNPGDAVLPVGTVEDLVISEVYGGGGNTNATFTNDFIELHNPTGNSIVVDGLSVQGRSSTNTSVAAGSNITPLTGSIPAGGHYLVQEAAGATVLNKPLPTPDATGTMAMAAGGWQVWLANTTSGLDPVDGDVRAGTPDPLIIDFVGAATNSASYETQAADEAPSATLATTRDASNTDTDNNKNDFSTATPAPRNSQPVVNVLAATNPGNRTVTVDTAITQITLAATGGTSPLQLGLHRPARRASPRPATAC